MNLVEIRISGFHPECSRKVLEHVNLKIKEGTLNVICGRSGCGKSTLLRQLKTVLAPSGNTSGQILYRGVSLKDTDHRTQSQEIGFVMQNPDNQIVTDKVWHELAFGLESLGCDNATIRLRVAEMASYFGIQQWFYKNVSELSRAKTASKPGSGDGYAPVFIDPGRANLPAGSYCSFGFSGNRQEDKPGYWNHSPADGAPASGYYPLCRPHFCDG